MAAVILMGLALAGTYLNNKQNPEDDQDGVSLSESKKQKKIHRKHARDSNIIPNDFIETDVNAFKSDDYKKSNTKSTDDDNIFSDHTLLFENSNKIINDVHYKKYLDKTKNDESFLDQFDDQRFDNNCPASAENGLDIDLERGLKEGYSVVNPDFVDDEMTYGLVNGKEFVHNNMVPFFSSKSYGDFDDKWNDNKQYKLDLFSGSSREYIQKKERAPLFNPFKNLTYAHGMPSTTDFQQSRYYASLGRERKNETLLQPQRVAPGLNQGYNANGIDGFHPSYRCLEKTVDELRTANNPKVSYSAPVKPGFRRSNRPVQAPVIKYRPETYRNELRRNMVKNLGYIRAPKVRDNFHIKDTNRSTTLREHYGVPGNSEISVGTNVPLDLIPKVRNTRRQVYRHPGISNAGRTGKGGVAYDPETWKAKTTCKEMTEHAQHIPHANRTNLGGIAYDPQDYRAKNTIKEITEHNQYMLGPNIGKGGIAYDPQTWKAKTTGKETTENNQYTLGPTRTGKGSVAYDPETWKAKNTVKELTEHGQYILGPTRSNGMTAYDPTTWRAKNTVKELTEHNQYILNASRTGKGGRAYDPANWKAKNTIKETTENNQHILAPSRTGKGTIAYDPETWKAKTTGKELTEHEQYILGPNEQGRGGIAYDPTTWKAKNTVKELTEHEQYILGPNRQGKGSVAYDPETWKAKTTGKELTENNQYTLGPTRIGKGSVAYDPETWKAKTTGKELTEHGQYILGPNRPGKGSVAYDPTTWKAKTTGKELTEHGQYILGPNRQGKGSVAYDPKTWKAKTTGKELTEHGQYILGPNRPGKGSVAYDPATWKAKNTVKELTENNQHTLGPTRTGKGSVAYNPKEWRAKNTIKELTEHNQYTLGPNRGHGMRAYDPETWKAKNTIKELTEHAQHTLGPNRMGKGSIVYDPNDKPSTTTKELTEHKQHILGPNRQGKGGVTYDPIEWEAKATNRETTQNTYYVPAGHAYGQDGPKSYDAAYNAQLNDCKEIAAMSGRAPTNSNYSKGPIQDMTNYKLKEPIHVNRDEIPDCSALNSLFRMPVNLTQARITLPQQERRLDETILEGLDTNPFSVPSYFNDCQTSFLQ